MVDHREHLKRWEPSLCMMRQWNGRSFMMREGEPARERRKEVRPHIAAPAPGEILRLAERWGEGIEDGAERDLDLEMAAYSVTLTGRALFDIDLENDAFRVAARCACCRGWRCWRPAPASPGALVPQQLCPRSWARAAAGGGGALR